MRFNYKLFRGSTDKNLIVTYVYRFEPTGEFATVQERPNGTVSIYPSFGISLSDGFERDSVYITSNQYFSFVSLLEKSVKLISDHLYEIFPNVDRAEFEIDTKTLDRFQTEKAIANDGITMVPAVWVNRDTNECHPGLCIKTLKFGSICIPLQDAIPIASMFSTFDPHLFAISMLRVCGRIE